MRRNVFLLTVSLLLVIGVTPALAGTPDFSWPANRDAIPDDQTAVQIAVSIFHAQFPKYGDPARIATGLTAYRYRTSDLVHDPKGDAWFVEPSQKEREQFEQNCRGECIGGDLFTMALSVHDGRVLEFYMPQ
jgi:hypothetical protein